MQCAPWGSRVDWREYQLIPRSKMASLDSAEKMHVIIISSHQTGNLVTSVILTML